VLLFAQYGTSSALLDNIAKITAAAAYPINKFIVLMMENRSFDHFLGFMKRDVPAIEGLTGTESNLYNSSDPKSQSVTVNENGFDTGPDDPCHSFNCITEQVYGYAKPVNVTATPKMNGFVQVSVEEGKTSYNPMSMFNSSKLPILYTLAEEFAVFDHWFCSAPTPTNPNRAYVMSGTSAGWTTNDIPSDGWPQQTHFEQLTAAGKTWRIYYSDDPWAALYFHNLRLPENLPYILPIEQFWVDLSNNDLPDYTFLEPRMATSPNGPSNWQHPDDSVRQGEALYKQVYEGLRASTHWNELAFVITYDEHGGFYDHVTPPQTGVPSPDGIKSPEGFNFDRLGVRIPTVVISPWINKGLVIHEPTGVQAPTPTSQWDATSIIATINKVFAIRPPLTTNRTIWAGTFDSLFTQRTSPRTDCPTTLPDIAPPTPEEEAYQRGRPLTDHELDTIKVLCGMNKRADGCGSEVRVSGDMFEWVTREWAYYRENVNMLIK
jgi:phospholipase C